jgi:hypothetical protein
MRRDISSTRRTGAILILALVIMAALAVILATTTSQIVMQRKLTHHRHRQLQAEWLARAGTEIAVARLLESPNAFVHEPTELVPDTTLRIEVEKTSPDLYHIRVEAKVGQKNEAPVARIATTDFRRAAAKGTVRLEPVRPTKGAP